MGFRKDAYATVWSVDGISDTVAKGKISISKKNKTTGEYETDFSGFISFIGSACVNKATKLKERDRIKLGDVDVTIKRDQESGKYYTNFNIYSFELQEKSENSVTTNDNNPEDGSRDPEDEYPF